MNSSMLISASQNQQSPDTPNLLRTGRARKRSGPEHDNDHDDDRLRKKARNGQKARNGEKTMSFDEVYQNGNAEYKHTIIQHPKDSGRWYILRCDEHGLHFGRNPLQGATKHLNGKAHGKIPRGGDAAIKKLGIRVRNCDAQSAERNNTVFKNALADGYELFRAGRREGLSTSGSDRLGQPEMVEEPGRVPDEASHNPRTNPPSGFQGIVDPVVGELYRSYFQGAYWAVLMLPTGSFEPVGMVGGIADTGLAANIPKCYDSNKQEKKIHGWADAYEDGERLTHRRKFPVMYLNGLNIPVDGEFEIPEGKLFSWVPARDLRLFDLADPECQSVHGFGAAQDFCQRMKAIRGNVARAEGRGMLLKEPTSLCSPDADEAVMNSGRAFQC